MSEDFVDVTWRGLEVVKKARLRGTGARTAYVEHSTPMPTGSQLAIRTADGLELSAIVARVQEQIGGRSEPPGMEVTIEATGAAATWWLERAEAAVAAAATPEPAAPEPPVRSRAAVRETVVMTATEPPAVEPPVMPVAPIETGPTRPSQRATAVTVPPPAGGPLTQPPPMIDARKTDLMFSVAAIEAAAAEDNGDAIPTGIDDSVDRPGDEIVDDGRRTMIMPAVDIAAIVEAGSKPDDDAGGGADKKKARGKRRKGR